MQRPIIATVFGAFVLILFFVDNSIAAEKAPFEYFSNPWNVVGLRDYNYGARISPTNEVFLADKGVLRFRFGRNESPFPRGKTKTALEGWIPVIATWADDGAVRYDFQFWATPLPSVKDWRKAFAWPTEGENFLVWTTVTVTNRGSKPVDAKLVAECVSPKPTRINKKSYTWKSGPKAPAPFTKTFAWKLKPNESVTACVRTPFEAIDNSAAFDDEDAAVWLQRTIEYWKNLMDSVARIDVPDRKATEALRAAHVCQLIASDHGELHGGEGYSTTSSTSATGPTRSWNWKRPGSGMARPKGHRVLPPPPTSRRPLRDASRINSTPTGRPSGCSGNTAKITGDRTWLEEVYPQMRKAADWTMRARRLGAGRFALRRVAAECRRRRRISLGRQTSTSSATTSGTSAGCSARPTPPASWARATTPQN